MLEKTPCVHCGNVGFVRWERVLLGDRAFVDFYCGQCEHAWRMAETGERRARPRVRRYTELPDYSRPSVLGHDRDDRRTAGASDRPESERTPD
jgi:hypothetical protein